MFRIIKVKQTKKKPAKNDPTLEKICRNADQGTRMYKDSTKRH